MPFPPSSIGVHGRDHEGTAAFCGNTLGQKHPDKNAVLFLHRNSAKFKDASSYFLSGPPKPVWTHVAQQASARRAGGQEGRRAGGQEGKRRGWSENVCACACSCMCVKSIPGKHAMANGLYMCACGRQGERDPWHLVFRGELPDEFFAGDDGNTHQECLMPRGGMLHSMQQVTPHTHTYTHIHTHTYTHTHTQHTLSCCKGKGHVKIKHASQKLKDFEQDLFHYLQELRDLPFYPGYRRCNADNMFFCKHP